MDGVFVLRLLWSVVSAYLRALPAQAQTKQGN
jgi:hypothetical protein